MTHGYAVNTTLDPGQNERESAVFEETARHGCSDRAIALFRDIILDYYRSSGRRLPWRETRDPFAITVSEMMLQQTQVDRVIPKYRAFLAAFPDWHTLAAAPVRDVLAAWQGLGYNRRALALHRTAQRVVGEFGGVLPADPKILATFPGIGPATASAICAYAFNLPVVYIETNIRRIFIHFFFAGKEQVSDSEVLACVGRALYREDPREWYNALMDYGTVLARRVANPNRKSAGYAVQGRFEGSDRQIRGRILRILLERGGSIVADLVAAAGGDEARVRALLAELEKEGFVIVRDERAALQGDRN
ncbi:MAG: A/G-specific adenine glycosylase [Methanomicrobiales archaeon]|nr:A/G-specific adenine glycosylase [Methanomicrobiales archaeon]